MVVTLERDVVVASVDVIGGNGCGGENWAATSCRFAAWGWGRVRGGTCVLRLESPAMRAAMGGLRTGRRGLKQIEVPAGTVLSYVGGDQPFGCKCWDAWRPWHRVVVEPVGDGRSAG